MRIYDLEDVDARRGDDAQVAVAPVVVLEVFEELGGVASLELVGRLRGLDRCGNVGVVFVIGFPLVVGFELLVEVVTAGGRLS